MPTACCSFRPGSDLLAAPDCGGDDPFARTCHYPVKAPGSVPGGALLWGCAMAVDEGSKAPDFTLMDQDRQPVTLSQLLRQGPVVLAFFPAAFSGTCQSELCTFRDSIATLSAAKGQVVGVSTDTFFALKAFATAQQLPFPLLSDYNKEVIRRYDVVNPDMIGLKDIAKRAVFVIDTDGVVRHREVLDDARLEPDYGRVQASLAAL